MNRSFPRWCKSSIAKWFHDQLASQIHFYVEGMDRRTHDHPAYVELRVDGPKDTLLSHNYHQVEVYVDTLVVSFINETDAYLHERYVGLVAEAFAPEIALWGSDTLLPMGCFQLRSGSELIITPFGPAKTDAKLMQTTIEATYTVRLSY